MTIEEMHARRCEIEEQIRDRQHQIEALKIEFNNLGAEIEHIKQKELDEISGVKI